MTPRGCCPTVLEFDGPRGLRAILTERRRQFVGTVTEKLLAYALGRGLEHYDRSSIRSITDAAADDDYRWSSMIVGIVQSPPFRMRRSKP